MGIKPDSLNGKIVFNESHMAIWTTNAVAIGSSAAEIAALQPKTTAARSAMTAQQAAMEAARTKTAELREAVRIMSAATSVLIQKVRTKAAVDGISVYNLANIPAPATPTPVGPPGTLSMFVAELTTLGDLDLTWKNSNATNAVYMVYRRFTDAGQYDLLIGSGEKKFTDSTIPPGTAQVQYNVQAVRSSGVSDWAVFVVNLGNNEMGTPVANILVEPTRIAA